MSRAANYQQAIGLLTVTCVAIAAQLLPTSSWGAPTTFRYRVSAFPWYSTAQGACDSVAAVFNANNGPRNGQYYAGHHLGSNDALCYVDFTAGGQLYTNWSYGIVKEIGCAAGYSLNSSGTQCIAVIDVDLRTPPKQPDLCGGNPIYPLTGAKTETIDIGLRLGGVSLRLTYDSVRGRWASGGDPGASGEATYGEALGAFWGSNFHRRLAVSPAGVSAQAVRGDGKVISFALVSSQWQPVATSFDYSLEAAGNTFRLHDKVAGSIEVYDSVGLLKQITSISGGTLTAERNAVVQPSLPQLGLLEAMSDSFGRRILFEYKTLFQGQPPVVSAAIDAAQGKVVFEYNEYRPNLQKIVWQDTEFRRLIYDDPGLTWALTGIEDEKRVRYSTYVYTGGMATATTQAGNANSYSTAHSAPPTVVTADTYDANADVIWRYRTWSAPQGLVVTDAAGQPSTIGTSVVQGQVRLSSRTQPAGSGCAASVSSQEFDESGNVSRRDDFNGTRSCFVHDLARNLESTRVEGLSNSASCASVSGAGVPLPVGTRKVSTEWHPGWRLTAKVAEPGRITTSIYNGQPDPFNGGVVASCAPASALLPDGKPIVVLCKQVEQATTDADGRLGFDASLEAGVANRVWSWTYNQHGQMLTSKGPRTDVNDTTTYDYYDVTTVDYTKGDLKHVINAANQKTQFTKYNRHGHVLESLDPNLVLTINTYDLRQRLKSTTVAGQMTEYKYDPVGQLEKVTKPDLSWIGYEYDDAQRLWAVKDSLGNRIEYVLDNFGNRKEEKVKDPNLVLRRALKRDYDALGRVEKTTTGSAAQ